MKVTIKTQKFGTSRQVKQPYELTDMDSYNAMVRIFVSEKNAWVNDVQVVEDGNVLMFVYNKRNGFLEYLTGYERDEVDSWKPEVTTEYGIDS